MKVLLVDDHPLILQALQVLIRTMGDDVTMVTAGSAREARAVLAEDDAFDLLLLDLQLGDINGFTLLAELRAAHPALPVVVVSASDRAADVIRAIDMGAMGFVPKRSSTETLTDALQTVMSGGIYVPSMVLSGGGTRTDDPAEQDTVPDVMRPHPRPPAGPPTLNGLGLTPRQQDVMQGLLQGKPNKTIARELNLSVETIKDHVAAVLRALNVSSRTQAVLAVGQMLQQQRGGWPPSRQ
ncbi:response regulator [Aquabacterium sp. J223]|uniref:response regulator n=1 Tax=Aquabacterium sp. J223 TaxID=2898431 RepID=UPI0021AE2CEA|nr:response regulator transcription factor [Aquabacterium sp. J223]UUX94032.1 response regulator transcription factor [Aquabacterium sp. J223]